MQTFHVKYFRTKSFALTLIPLIILIFSLSFFLLDTKMLLKLLPSATGIFILIAVIMIPGVLLRKLFFSTLDVTVDQSNIVINKNGNQVATLPLQNLTLIKYLPAQNPPNYQIYDEVPKVLFSFSDIKNTDAQKLVQLLKEKCSLVNASIPGKGLLSPEQSVFARKEALQHGILATVTKQYTSIKRKGKIITTSVLLGIFAFLILPFFINKKGFYDTRNGKVYFGNTEMKGIKENEFTNIGYNVGKDCTRIFFRGQPVDFVDRSTFRALGSNLFYADKNGLYYETTNLYSKNKLKPLEGAYDRNTFHELGYSNYYKDKNNLYTISVFGNEPLKKLEISGIDVASFKELSSIWFADKNAVYFASYDDIKPCKNIDRATFEILAWQVAKDKNHVYYLTYGLKSEEHEASDKVDDYAILEKADAATFTMVNENSFYDKNTTWTITKEGEKTEPRDEKAGAAK